MKRTLEVDGFVFTIRVSVFLRQDQGYDFGLFSNLFSYQTIMNGSVRVGLSCLIIKLTKNSVFYFIIDRLRGKSMKFSQTIKFD